MTIQEILKGASQQGASDIFLVGGLPLTYKVNGKLKRIDEDKNLMPNDIKECLEQLYEMIGRPLRKALTDEDDFSFALSDCGRFRANVFTQRGSAAAVIRVIKFGIPDPEEYGIPRTVLDIARQKAGLILVTGAAGNGKSTTLACMIDEINENFDRTIITMEDPIEIVHRHKKSIVIQREISTDTEDYSTALKAAMREAPDVLLIGEIRDGETMEAAMTAAETGELIFSTLHTLSASDTVDRVIDFFPEKQQPQIRAQLAGTLKSVVCQKLVPGIDGKPVPAFEIMNVTPAIRNLIRQGKTYQFKSLIKEGAGLGMCSMNSSLYNLAKAGKISKETAILYSDDPNQMEKKLSE